MESNQTNCLWSQQEPLNELNRSHCLVLRKGKSGRVCAYVWKIYFPFKADGWFPGDAGNRKCLNFFPLFLYIHLLLNFTWSEEWNWKFHVFFMGKKWAAEKLKASLKYFALNFRLTARFPSRDYFTSWYWVLWLQIVSNKFFLIGFARDWREWTIDW
jgi:hypothetical protein